MSDPAARARAADDETIEQAMQAALAEHKAGRLAAARAGYQQILQKSPNHARALHALGLVEKSLGNLDVAVELISRAVAIQPAAEFYNNLGDALTSLGRTDEAVAACARAIAISPGYVKAFNNLGLARLKQGRVGDAAAALSRAVALKPDYSRALANLAAVYTQSGRHAEALEHYRQALQADPNYVTAHSSMLMLLNYFDLDPLEVFEAHRVWAQRHAEPITAAASAPGGAAKPQAEGEGDADRPLRVGFVSGDFSSHAVAGFFMPVLNHRDRARVQVTCYSSVARGDEVTREIQQKCDAWREIANVSDDDAAEMVRRDRIDVLVDLAGHSAKNRLLLFARRPAPVQVTWLGYPNTTGMSAMNYRLTDPLADPPGMTESLHTEKLIRLRSNWCYPPPAPALTGEVVPPPASTRADGTITFGSFNNLAKLTPRWLQLWSRILDAVPNARLLIKSNVTGDTEVQRRVRGHFAQPNRVELLGREHDLRKHFARYGEVDIMLDPFPYHGTTMTCEALWMGVPVVTMAGRSHVSRVGVSLLTQVGLSELIAQTDEEYAAIATALAKDVGRLIELRRTMRERMLRSPLLDGAGFMRELTNVLRAL
jgi:predicted O-linked N-acetylglucosamine transferase (SPINDLY family)